jgi:hypothetical protein
MSFTAHLPEPQEQYEMKQLEWRVKISEDKIHVGSKMNLYAHKHLHGGWMLDNHK